MNCIEVTNGDPNRYTYSIISTDVPQTEAAVENYSNRVEDHLLNPIYNEEFKSKIITNQNLAILKNIFEYTDKEATEVLDYYQWDVALATRTMLNFKNSNWRIEPGF